MTTPTPPTNVTTLAGLSSAGSRPDTHHPLYDAMRLRWTVCRDVAGGTEVFRAKRDTYLPRFEGEESTDWAARVDMSFVFDALAQTVAALVGLAFRKDPVLGPDVPVQMKELWENLDGEGTHGALVAQQVLTDALLDGHAGLLVDYPAVPANLSAAQEQALGARPYLVPLTASQIINWRVEAVGSRRMLTLLVVEELAPQAVGAFGHQSLRRWRVFYQRWQDEARTLPFVEYEVYEQAAAVTGTGPRLVVGPAVLGNQSTIPFFPVYGGCKRDWMVSDPPLIGLAYSNINHAQVASDRRYSLHKCAIPVPVFVGRAPSATGGEEIKMSSSSGIDVVIGGNAFYMEPAGAALGALREELLDIEKRMAGQGLSLLQRDQAAAETATAFALQRSREESRLATAVRSCQDALEGALGAMAAYLRLLDGGSVEMSRDFTTLGISANEIATLSTLVERGQLPLSRLLGALAKGGVLPEDINPEQAADQAQREQAAGEPAPAPMPTGDLLAALAGNVTGPAGAAVTTAP